jgi:AcrR family transcriptional regulator
MRTDERRQQLRAALIAAAERIIAERGLAQLKARDLAEAVGCALGSIYNVFPDLDGLVLQVNLRTLALFESCIADAVDQPLSTDAVAEGGADPDAATADLVRLALAYLAFARGHALRWRALFQHRMADESAPPDWYLKEQVRLFRYIEEPLGRLCPRLAAQDRQLLARSVFSATHGMVSLGLEEKLMSLPAPMLDAQIEQVVRAIGRGLAAGQLPASG